MAAYRIKYCSKCERSTGHDISGACMVCGVVLPKTVVSKAPLYEDMRDFNAKRFQSWENHCLQFLDIDSRRHVNCLRFSRSDSGRSESDAHIQAKLDEVKGPYLCTAPECRVHVGGLASDGSRALIFF
jgi:hypothetical protein